MNNSKLIKILSTFSKKELKQFEIYATDKYGGQQDTTIHLLDCILKGPPHFASQQLEPERLFHFMFPNRQFKAQLLYNHLSYLTRLAEKFLVETHFTNSKMSWQLQLAIELRARGLAELSQQAILKLTWMLNKEEQRDDAFFFTQYLETP